MTIIHVVVIAIGAGLAAFGAAVNKSSDIIPVATMIVGGAMGNASVNRNHRQSDEDWNRVKDR